MKRKHVNPGPDHDYDTARMESILPRTGDYSTWSESELRSEIARRHIKPIFGFSSRENLIEILTRNDQLSSELKKIAARYIGHKDTKP